MTTRIRQLRDEAQRRTSNLYDTLFARRVSIYFTALFFRLGISPNVVSIVGLLTAISACALLAFGNRPLIIFGVCLVHLYAVLDSVDGELARLTRRFSLLGLFLEDWSAYTMINGFQLAVAWYLHRQGVLWSFPLAVAFVALGRNAMPAARRAIIKSIITKRPPSSTSRSEQQRNGGLSKIRGVIEDHILHYTYIWIITTTVILIEQLAGLEHLRLARFPFAFYTVGLLLKEAAVLSLLCLGGLERQLFEIYKEAEAIPRDERNGLELAGDHSISLRSEQ